MSRQPGFFDTDERLRWLSAAGDPLERLASIVDFELFRPELDAALGRSDRAKGGRPPYEAVLMFRTLVLQTLYTLSDDQPSISSATGCPSCASSGSRSLIRCRTRRRSGCSGNSSSERMRSSALFERFDAALRERGFLAMGGQIVMRQSSRRAGRG